VITREPIRLVDGECDANNGAVASFLGVVRARSGAHRVVSIHYDCYQPMAERAIGEISAEASARFDIGEASVVHRVGEVPAGDASLRVVVRARHRAAAFECLRWVVDEVKRRVPIWKKEQYDDGSSRWLE
jgi:molybdopterin synthase catalytic subunit